MAMKIQIQTECIKSVSNFNNWKSINNEKLKKSNKTKKHGATKAIINENLIYETNAKKKIGDTIEVSPMGLGTWSWGNKFLWDYDTNMDPELQKIFNLAVSRGINLFDTADSYGQ